MLEKTNLPPERFLELKKTTAVVEGCGWRGSSTNRRILLAGASGLPTARHIMTFQGKRTVKKRIKISNVVGQRRE